MAAGLGVDSAEEGTGVGGLQEEGNCLGFFAGCAVVVSRGRPGRLFGRWDVIRGVGVAEELV